MVDKGILIIAVWLSLLIGGCVSSQGERRVVFEEEAGITRALEYVSITLPDQKESFLFLKEVTTGIRIKGEKLNTPDLGSDSSSYLFPISIKANDKRVFIIDTAIEDIEHPTLKIIGSEVSITVENEFFIADFNTNKAKVDVGLYPGQLAGIFIKNKNMLLKRGHINMHWAPNFQKEGKGYKTIGHVNSVDASLSQNNPYMLELSKSGQVDDFQEIDLFGQYRFYAGLPYIEYTSTISFNKEIELILLRNDEMTMDSLFTHLIYPSEVGGYTSMPLYNMDDFDALTKSPLKDDIAWVGFINESLGYGLVSLRLEYDNDNLDGQESPMYGRHTKISVNKGNGRYWNRRLIHDHKTLVPEGSRYFERNAYLVVDNLSKIEDQISYYLTCLKSPVSYTIK